MVQVGRGAPRADSRLGVLPWSSPPAPAADEKRVGTVLVQTPLLSTTIGVEQAPTRDAVPLNVDAVVCWRMHGTPSPVAFDQPQGFVRLARMALREGVGASTLATLLGDRPMAERLLVDRIALETLECGVTVCGVEICRLAIPAALQAEGDARSLAALRSTRSRHDVGADQAALARGQ